MYEKHYLWITSKCCHKIIRYVMTIALLKRSINIVKDFKTYARLQCVFLRNVCRIDLWRLQKEVGLLLMTMHMRRGDHLL